VIFLDLDVKSADAFVVELDRVAFLAADRDRRHEILEHAAAIGAVQDADRDAGDGSRGGETGAHRESVPEASSNQEQQSARRPPWAPWQTYPNWRL
jgi:hypothetical protein